jgi:iron complex outermembrane receptor protein
MLSQKNSIASLSMMIAFILSTTSAVGATATPAADPNAAPAAEPNIAAAAEPSPVADDTADSQSASEVVVSARIRAEKIEDVPIPVSAINGDTLTRLNALTVTDFAKLTPNLLVNAPNARQTSIAIRGIGKNTANDALEPSVGLIVDGVASAYIAQSWGNFPDVEHIEVERGPQGTLLGKNTTLGVVQVVTKAPSFTEGYTAEAGTGEGEDLDGRFTATGPVVDNLLAYRASFYGEKRNGPLHNQAPDQTNEYFQERNRFGGKLQFLLTPTDDLSARFIFDRQEAAELIPWGEAPLIGDPTTFPNGVSRTLGTGTTYTSRLSRGYFGGYTPFIANWDSVDNNGSRPTRSNNGGLSAQIDWKLHGYTITSISAVRNSMFDAKNDNDWTHFDIGRGGAIIKQTQVSEELRLSSSLGQRIDYTTGLYFLNSHIHSCDRSIYGADGGAFYATNAQYAALSGPVGRDLLADSVNHLFVYTCTDPRTISAAGFGQVNWHITDKGTLTVGGRATNEDKHNDYLKTVAIDSPLAANITAGAYPGATAAQLSAAQGIRSQLTNSLGSVTGQPINATSYAWLFNPSYKVSEDILVYASASHGEKSGAVLFNTTALTPQNVKPERALDFELGIKAVLLDRRLTVNVNLYDTEVSDYQQNITVPDSTTTTGFRTFLGNASKVQLRGIELDSSFVLNEVLSVNWGGAFNHAIYADFKDAPCPADIAAQTDSTGKVVGPFNCNLTGQQIPYAPKFTTNVGLDLHQPIGHGFAGHAYVNEVFRSRANNSAGLSSYGFQGSYSLVDGGIGVLTQNEHWEFDFVGTNLFDKKYAQDITTFTNQAAVTAYPGDRRYVGFQARLKL